VPEGDAPDPAGGQEHPPAGGQEVLGDLAAGLGAADDQHRPVRELAGGAVAGGVDLHDPVGEGAGQGGAPWLVLVAGGDDHRPGPELAGVAVEGEPVAGGGEPRYPDALADGAAVGQPLEPLHDLASGEVGVPRLGAEQPVHPADGVEPERVPPLRAPALAGPAALQDHVVDPSGGQGEAGGQAGRPRAHDQAAGHRRSSADRSAARNASGRSIERCPASSMTSSGQP
jgi:hypothetical protein